MILPQPSLAAPVLTAVVSARQTDAVMVNAGGELSLLGFSLLRFPIHSEIKVQEGMFLFFNEHISQIALKDRLLFFGYLFQAKKTYEYK